MNKNSIVGQFCWTCGGFIFAFFAVGIPWWSFPYNESLGGLTLLFVWLGMFSVAIAAALARIIGHAGFYLTIPFISLSVPSAILARVIFETIANPTTHNLWPFEIVVGEAYGLFFAALGALSGTLFVWIAKRAKS
jgi:hypothetical protein